MGINMKHQTRTTSDGKIIEIYDDVFPPSMRNHHILFAQNCNYRLGNTSIDTFSERNKTFFQSLFSPNDYENFKFHHEVFQEKLKIYPFWYSWVIASSPLSTYYYHTDITNTAKGNAGLSLLYYLNKNWNRDWGGETIFANDSGECEIAVEYKPNRVVIFDSSIEHKPSPISMSADEFRFIFVIQACNVL